MLILVVSPKLFFKQRKVSCTYIVAKQCLTQLIVTCLDEKDYFFIFFSGARSLGIPYTQNWQYFFSPLLFFLFRALYQTEHTVHKQLRNQWLILIKTFTLQFWLRDIAFTYSISPNRITRIHRLQHLQHTLAQTGTALFFFITQITIQNFFITVFLKKKI